MINPNLEILNVEMLSDGLLCDVVPVIPLIDES